MSSPNFTPDTGRYRCCKCKKAAIYRVHPKNALNLPSTVCKKHLEKVAVEGDTIQPLLSEVKQKIIKAIKPSDLDAFIGKTLKTKDGQDVVVETIVGSMFKPSRFEINGKHHIVILDAYKQLNGDKSITPQMIKAFDEMQTERIEKAPDLISATPPNPKAN